MRDLFLAVVVLIGLGTTLRYPFAGILLWAWFTCMDPHDLGWGFMSSAPVNLIIVCVTLLAWLFSKERKAPLFDAMFFLTFAFLVWITINGFFAVDPAWSWPLWNRTWKTIALGICVGAITTNRIRAHALVWSVVVSLLYYGIKGGIFTILTGGQNHVLGPSGSMISDNNHLAVATLMVLPLANYLRLHSANRWITSGLLAAIALSTLSVIGSYSRGAFIALGGLGLVAWLRARNKLIYPIAAALVLVPAFYLMPSTYYDRLQTINTASADDSFHGRQVAWQVAWDYARDHFPVGAGFAGPQLPQVFNHYFPEEPTHAAHSIFFEVLGDNGFIGFALYLTILLIAFWNCSRIRAATRNRPELAWAYDLSSMVQLTLFVFCLGGSALSLAYYDIPFICFGLLSAMRAMLRTSPSMSAPPVTSFKRGQNASPRGFYGSARNNSLN